ncbi:MAG: RNA polymerase sigma factor [Acidobacteriota bacterium]
MAERSRVERSVNADFEMPLAGWRSLFARLADGDPEALETLYDVSARTLYGLALWRTGSKEDAADVVQGVFLRLAERRNRLINVEDPRAWLLAVTHRAAVDFCRRRSVRRTESLDVCAYLTAPAEDPDREMDARRASRLLEELSAEQRSVIYLHHYAGNTFEEVGKALGIPQFTAASRYRQGVKKLRELLEGKR